MAALVVDHLRINMFQTAEYSQPRPLLGTPHLVADAAMDADANIVFLNMGDTIKTTGPGTAIGNSTSSAAATQSDPQLERGDYKCGVGYLQPQGPVNIYRLTIH